MRKVGIEDLNPGAETWKPPVRGPECYCPILILCDAPTEKAFNAGLPLDPVHHKWLGKLASKNGFEIGDIKLIGLCPPIPENKQKIVSKAWEHVETHKEEVFSKIRELKPQVVVTFGALATRVMTGRPTKITKARGVPIVSEPPFTETHKGYREYMKVFPMLSPGFVRRIPDHAPVFEADLVFLKRYQNDLYEYSAPEVDYQWVINGALEDICTEIESALVISVDTETQGGTRWWDDDIKLLSVQICVVPGRAFVFPVCDDWCGYEHGQTRVFSLVGNERTNIGYNLNRSLLRKVLENPKIKKIGHNCVDNKTEVLTPDGWISISELTYKDQIMQFDHITDSLSFTHAQKIVKKNYTGHMYEWNTQFHKGMYTPDHRMLASYNRGNSKEWVYETAENVAKRHPNGVCIPISGNFDGGMIDVDDSLIRLCEAARADGNIRRGAVRFRFKKQRKIDRLIDLCDKCGIKYSLTNLARDIVSISLLKSKNRKFIIDLFEEGKNKNLGSWVLNFSPRQRGVWLDEACFWDGSEAHYGTSRSFSTADYKTATWFQIMAHTSGYRYPLRTIKNNRGYNEKNDNAVLWNACLRQTNRCKLIKNAKKVNYNDKVYCVTVPTGSFMVRRDGVVWITGNCKFEHMMLKHKLGIEIKGWLHDTQLMLFNINENLMDKSLETGVRIYVPEMAGYESALADYDKANMAAVPRDAFVQYSAGDADATFRLAQRLKPLLDKDLRQRRCYRKIQMPAILAFAESIEQHGIRINLDRLQQFGEDLDKYLEDTYKKLILYTPAKVKQTHLDNKKELSLSRAKFLIDILFGEDGFNLEPIIFTASTEDLPDDEKVPSTSAKEHLPYFVASPQIISGDYTVGDYVLELTDYKKAKKLKSTYCGDKEENTGMWQYLDKDNKIHPSYMLHRTNTARSASADPNGQNRPVRGVWVEQFEDMFECEEGWVRISCDLSQIELRLAAWRAAEPTMLKIYQEGGDIHAMTAAAVTGIDLYDFMRWKENSREDFDLRRYNAKATNFGFLYGLGSNGFQRYAKTDYGIDYTEEECWSIRNTFFNTYYGLPVWHKSMKEFARKHGYIRSLLGRVRHLPGVNSEDQGIRAMCERQAINAGIQGMASELGTIALTRFANQAPKEVIHVNEFIHDDIRAEVREDVAEEAAAALKWVVEHPPWHWFGITPPLPIIGDLKIGKEERPDIKACKPYWWRE